MAMWRLGINKILHIKGAKIGDFYVVLLEYQALLEVLGLNFLHIKGAKIGDST